MGQAGTELLEKQMEQHLVAAIKLGKQIQRGGFTPPDVEAVPGKNTRELALATTNAEQGLHWLGADLARKGIE